MFNQNRANNFSASAEFIFNNDIDIKSLKYNIIEYTTPTSILAPVQVAYGGEVGTIPGDTIEKEQSTLLRFIVDENLIVWFTLNDIQEENSKGKKASVFNLNILDNKHKLIATATYSNAWIGTISPLRYSTVDNETTVYVEVTLNYLKFEAQAVN